jgi:hypothetical protein
MGAINSISVIDRFIGRYEGAADVGEIVENISDSIDMPAFSDGVSAYQANRVWWKTLTAGGIGTNYDLAGGGAGISDVFGDPIVLGKVKIFGAINRNTVSGDTLSLTGSFVTIGLGSIVGITVPPSGFFLIVSPIDGYSIVDGVNSRITVTKTGPNNVITDLIIVGNT